MKSGFGHIMKNNTDKESDLDGSAELRTDVSIT